MKYFYPYIVITEMEEPRIQEKRAFVHDV